MSLRIVKAGGPVMAAVGPPNPPDDWPSRLAKLIPAEALGLYGAGQSMIPRGRVDVLWGLAVVCLLFAAAIRWKTTQDPVTKKPQWIAILIALVSFALWIAALPQPPGPLDLGANAFIAGLAAVVWATIVPVFYKG